MVAKRMRTSSEKKKSSEAVNAFCNGNTNSLRCFSIKELKHATNNYSSLEMTNGLCKWYKGTLDRQTIFVKVFDMLDHFINDILIAAQLDTHNNVLKLLGCCLGSPDPISVYEFAPNGTLSDHIYTSDSIHTRPLSWKSRMLIAIEIASTVAHLHTAFIRPFIHRGLTTSNILLDEYNVAKLSDFSLSTMIPEGETHVEDVVRGTIGFIAPEYFGTNSVTEKSDVYSFGVLVLEILTGQRALQLLNLANDDNRTVVDYVLNHVLSDTVHEIVDPIIFWNGGGQSDLNYQVTAVLELTCRCMKTNVEDRPTMVDVTKQLKQIVRLPRYQILFTEVEKEEFLSVAKSRMENKQRKRQLISRILFNKRKKSFLKNKNMLFAKLFSSCSTNGTSLRVFSAINLQQATNNYDISNILHQDAVYKWYKGSLNGEIVSIKVFENSSLNYFINDIVVAIAMNTHNNVMKLIGYCHATEIPVTVYEFAENGILSEHIYISGRNRTTSQPLLWNSRLSIAMQIANLTAELHSSFLRPVIVRDLKLSNFYLDQNCVPKFSDFSLSILLPEGETEVEDRICGTMGYVAPEYIASGIATVKVDVFAFGMILLQLLTGKRAYDLQDTDFHEHASLLDYFKEGFVSKWVNRLVDPTILTGVENDMHQQLQAVAELALRCLKERAEERPSMIDAAEQLEQIANICPRENEQLDKIAEMPPLIEI